MYVFISESETFTDFNDKSALIWYVNNFEYGDWSYGENKDGILTKKNEIILTEVNKSFIYIEIIYTQFNLFLFRI